MNLKDIYGVLLGTQFSAKFLGKRVDDLDPPIYLAIDSEEKPAIFFETNEFTHHPPLSTNELLLSLYSQCTLETFDHAKKQKAFNILKCNTITKPDIDAFLMVCQSFISGAKREELSSRSLLSLFHSLRRLFATVPEKETEKVRIGLWGELFFMRAFGGFDFWARYWHEDPMDRFDFYGNGQALEVKTTLREERVHEFSHRQVYSQNLRNIAVASLKLNPTADGLSLLQLISECKQQLTDLNAAIKLERAARKANMMGTPFPGPIFDADHSKESTKIYFADSIPHFNIPEPPGVFNTKYNINFSDSRSMSQEDISAWLNSWNLKQ